jgi:hypothetical protein
MVAGRGRLHKRALHDASLAARELADEPVAPACARREDGAATRREERSAFRECGARTFDALLLKGVVTPTPPQPDQCAIALWRGYVNAQFYARPPDRDEALCWSPVFRAWRLPWAEPTPIWDDQAAVGALAALETTLYEGGWERIRRAARADWYELRFRRATSAASALGPALALPRSERSPSNLAAVRSARRARLQAD